MSSNKIYIAHYTGNTVLIEAPSIAAVRDRVMEEIGFDARFAKATEVAGLMANGHKLLRINDAGPELDEADENVA